ncbi:von Willebrand factor type A domain-containing protein [Mycena vulgaris]|nr:von Willebrand factor type A domain-containing protein [Mycena vulgaris]
MRTRHGGPIPQVYPWGLYYYSRDNNAVVSLPLLNVRVIASIKELAAQVKMTQTYGNDANDGTRIVGRIQEKMEARETYEEALSQGKQAALMEQQTPDVFQLAVGNIQPNEQVQIELIYATTLSEDEDNDSVRFHLPVHVGARYWPTFLEIFVNVEAAAPIAKIGCPSHSVSTELGPDPALPNAQELQFSNYARVSLSSDSALDKDYVLTVKSAGLDAPRCVAELHPIHATVALALTLVPRFKLPDLARQEFILLIDRSGSMGGQRIAAAKKALVVMLRSLPATESMFQIASFGSHSTMLWSGGSRPYNQATLDEATQHVDGMQADYGGTEIRGALQQCFETRKTDRPTTVFLLTDGEAWDVDGVLNEVKDAVSRAPAHAYLRVSVLGIGNSVSTAMCEGIARVGNGTCMMVGEQETTFTGKIARMLKAARTPMITDIRVDWGVPVVEAPQIPDTGDEDDAFVMVPDERDENSKGKGKEKERHRLNIFDETVDPMQVDAESVPPSPPVVLSPPPQVQQSPFKIRTLSPGNRLNVYAILQGKTVPKTVTLTGLTEDGSEIRLPIPVTLSNLPNAPESPPAIHALAARMIIQDLEDGQHSLAIDDADLLARTVKASVVRLGKEYSISSSQTSFVAVDDSPPSTNSPRRSVRLRQPDFIVLPSVIVARSSARSTTRGRGTARVVGGGKAARKQLARKDMATSAAPKTASVAPAKLLARAAAAASMLAPAAKKRKRGRGSQNAEDEPSEPPAPPMDPLEALARLQSFDGCFSLAILSTVPLTMDISQAKTALFEGISDEVFATIIALAFLRTKLGPEIERESWEAMYDKGHAFVEGVLQSLGDSVGVDELEAKAVAMLV